MKYYIVLIMSFLFISCALEKEETSYVNSIFEFTTASVRIDSINNYRYAPACIDFFKGDNMLTYTIISDGKYGSDVDAIIRNSYIQINRARLYFDDNYVDIPIPSNIKYNATVPQPEIITKSMVDKADIADGKYHLSIEMVASEYNGNGINTVLNEIFSYTFGEVMITSNGAGCPY